MVKPGKRVALTNGRPSRGVRGSVGEIPEIGATPRYPSRVVGSLTAIKESARNPVAESGIGDVWSSVFLNKFFMVKKHWKNMEHLSFFCLLVCVEGFNINKVVLSPTRYDFSFHSKGQFKRIIDMKSINMNGSWFFINFMA